MWRRYILVGLLSKYSVTAIAPWCVYTTHSDTPKIFCALAGDDAPVGENKEWKMKEKLCGNQPTNKAAFHIKTLKPKKFIE